MEVHYILLELNAVSLCSIRILQIQQPAHMGVLLQGLIFNEYEFIIYNVKNV
jgi:hypothetical protein